MSKEPDNSSNLGSSPDLTPFHSAHGAFQESLRQIAKDLGRELDEASKARWEAWNVACAAFDRLREEEQPRYYEALQEAAKSERPYADAENAHEALINALREGARAEFEAQRSAEETHSKVTEQIRLLAIERVQEANRKYVGDIRKAWSEIRTNSFEQSDLYTLGASMAGVAADTESAIRACRY